MKETIATPCNRHILDALEVAAHLLELADDGDAVRQDDGCGVLYGVMRDAAYRIRREAERERDVHIAQGKWASNT